ncbi:MAG: hypothetical protein QNJ20_10145 [Paracoccaceae bacterium]|nr:hypothetical protein [Paracoccaceae bacterium]
MGRSAAFDADQMTFWSGVVGKRPEEVVATRIASPCTFGTAARDWVGD